MSSRLPTGPAATKAVKDFGIGTYDAPSDFDMHGEDDENMEPAGKTLPDGGGSLDPFGPERLLSYPESSTSQGKHASAMLPDDYDRPPSGENPDEDVIDNVLMSDAGYGSELPDDGDNPSARSDYYDPMSIGTAMSDLFADEDSGAYASSLPEPTSNETDLNDWLSALGNFWSGYTVEDQDVPYGFPSDVDPYNEGDFGGVVMANDKMARVQADSMDVGSLKSIQKRALDVKFVVELTGKFLKKHGKENITRRAVTAFLQEEGYGDRQYLASDIIRCLKHNRKIVVPDVLDVFPLAKTASVSSIGGLHQKLVTLEIENIRDPEVAGVFRRCAANLAHVMAYLERIDG